APDPPVTLPVALTRVVPSGHLPGDVGWSAKLINTIVLPLPPFHVYVPVKLPFWEPAGGGVNADVAPALSAAGVQPEIGPVALPVLSGGALSFEQVRDCLSAADPGIAIGSVSAKPAAATSARPRSRVDPFM